MQVTTITEAAVSSVGGNKGGSGEPAESGGFDLVLAAAGALFNMVGGCSGAAGQNTAPGEFSDPAGDVGGTGGAGEDPAGGAQWMQTAVLPVAAGFAAIGTGPPGPEILQERPVRSESPAGDVQAVAKNLTAGVRQDYAGAAQSGTAAAVRIAAAGWDGTPSGPGNSGEVRQPDHDAGRNVIPFAADLETGPVGGLPREEAAPAAEVERPAGFETVLKAAADAAGKVGRPGPEANSAGQGCETAVTVVENKPVEKPPPGVGLSPEVPESDAALSAGKSLHGQETGSRAAAAGVSGQAAEQEPGFAGNEVKHGAEFKKDPAGVETKSSSPDQAGAVQNGPAFKARTADGGLKTAELPGFKEKLVQEIKHVLVTYRGEPQALVKLKLDSEQLGQLTVRLVFNKGELSAHFYTENSYARNFIEGSLQQLKESLAQQDLRLNEALVFSADDRGGGPGQYSGERGGQELHRYGGYGSRYYSGAQEKPLDPPDVQPGNSRVNYLI